MVTGSNDFTAWIGKLRARAARRDLDGRGTATVGAGVMPGGLAARTLLTGLDHDGSLTLEERQDPFHAERRRLVLADLHRLHDQLD